MKRDPADMLLFRPLTVHNLKLKNRLVMAPCGTNTASDEGFPTEAQVEYYRQRAEGGVGLVILEATTVNHHRRRRESNCLGIYEDRFIRPMRTLAKKVQDEGARVGVQLVDSLVRIGKKPADFSKEEVHGIIEDFVQGAVRAQQAGFDLVELHMAHLYTLADFLSRQTNRRTDEFGQGMAGRLRIAEEILGRARQQLGSDFTLGCRINGDEFVLGGNTLADSQVIAQRLVELGADVISVSAGGRMEADGSRGYSFSRCIPPSQMPDATNAYLAGEIRRVAGVPIMTAGKIGDPGVAEAVLQEGKADLIALGRPLLADPAFARKAQEGHWEEIRLCRFDNQCMAGILDGKPWTCVVYQDQ
ncbi:MAG: NADH:flavin oxidoreductase [Nitrospinae bacterium]|nr:NADH:flavin oxidoreductase [Nitrospinota bacterium]